MPTKERTKENCRCFDAADPRLRGCTPLRTPIRKSEGPMAKRTQYYCPFLTPSALPPLLSRVFPRTPDADNGCFVGAAYMPPATFRRNPLTGNHPQAREPLRPASRPPPLMGRLLSRAAPAHKAPHQGSWPSLRGLKGPDGPCVNTRSRATTRQLQRGRAAALPCPSRPQPIHVTL